MIFFEPCMKLSISSVIGTNPQGFAKACVNMLCRCAGGGT